MTNHMNKATHEILMELYDNPVKAFVDYEVTREPTEKDEKIRSKMSEAERIAYDQIPEDIRIQIREEYQGLITCLSAAADLAYDISNGIPNNPHKIMALGLLRELCKSVALCCKPISEDDSNGE